MSGHLNLQMEQCIWDNGEMGRDREEENKFGRMEVYMRANGKMIKQMVKGD